MPPVNPPTYLQAGSYSAQLDRQALAALLTPHAGAGPLVARSGVKPLMGGTSLQVIQRPTPDMWVRVKAGTCYIATTSTLGGTYIGHNDGDYDVQLTAAHATLPRKDLIYARVADAVGDTGTANELQISVVTGTAASSPVRPAAPSQSIPLAEIAVSANDTSIVTADITDLRTYVTGLGGTLPVRGASDVPANPFVGMKIYRLDLLVEQVWDGTYWRSYLDTGAAAPIGTIGYGYWDCTPNYQVVSTGGVSIRYDSTNVARTNFTMPPNVPTGRVLRFTITMNALLATGGRVTLAPYIDSTTLVLERRANLIADTYAHSVTQISAMPVSALAAGAHFMEVRARVDASGSPATVASLEMHIEVI